MAIPPPPTPQDDDTDRPDESPREADASPATTESSDGAPEVGAEAAPDATPEAAPEAAPESLPDTTSAGAEEPASSTGFASPSAAGYPMPAAPTPTPMPPAPAPAPPAAPTLGSPTPPPPGALGMPTSAPTFAGAPGVPTSAPSAGPAPGAPGAPLPAPAGASAGAGGYYPQEAFYAPGWSPQQQTRTPRRWSRPVLWSLIGVLSTVLVVGVVLGVLYLVQTRSIGTVTSATAVTTQQVRPGHCIRDLPEDGSVGRVTLVPCSEPHEAQALSRISLRFDSWPGRDAVDEQAAGACEMSNDQVADGFRAVVWTPTERSWGQGDHRALCIAWLPDGQYTGSFENGDLHLP